MEKIYFKGGENYKTIPELLMAGFDTDDGKFVPTYSDPLYTDKQCNIARRSYSDIFYICKTYFPNTTREEVAYELTHLNGICCLYCGDVEKIVFRRAYQAEFDNRNLLDGEEYERGVDDISFNDIVDFRDVYKQHMFGEKVTLHDELI